MRSIDLNCDLGEVDGDSGPIASVTSASVACGVHAGDDARVREAVRLARAAGVAVGAHPGLPDRAGHGRTVMPITPREVENLVLRQVRALAVIASGEGVALRHVKAHGALYNMAARDRAVADALVRGVQAFDPSLVLFALSGSEMLSACLDAHLSAASEGFADRAYGPDGFLIPRSQPRAILSDVKEVVARAVRMAVEGRIVSTGGGDIAVHVDTICIHGDTPGAPELARTVRAGLEQAGLIVGPFRGSRASRGAEPC